MRRASAIPIVPGERTDLDRIAAGDNDAGCDARKLLDLGLVSADCLSMSSSHHVDVFPPVTDGAWRSLGFRSELEEAVRANSQKLAAARPRETHLVAVVGDPATSPDPADTPVPSVPAEIDVLWVVLAVHFTSYGVHRVWRADRGATEWAPYWNPYGARAS